MRRLFFYHAEQIEKIGKICYKKFYGVKITRDGKDYSYLHPNKQKPIRGEKLGTNYSKTEVLKQIVKQNNGRAFSTRNRGRISGFIKQSTGIGALRGGKTINGGSARSVVNASLNGIKRTLQRLSFEAECASRGTDASSEERRIIQRKAREEAERRRREADRQREREQLQTNEGDRVLSQSDNGNGNGNRVPCKHS